MHLIGHVRRKGTVNATPMVDHSPKRRGCRASGWRRDDWINKQDVISMRISIMRDPVNGGQMMAVSLGVLMAKE